MKLVCEVRFRFNLLFERLGILALGRCCFRANLQCLDGRSICQSFEPYIHSPSGSRDAGAAPKAIQNPPGSLGTLRRLYDLCRLSCPGQYQSPSIESALTLQSCPVLFEEPVKY